LVVGQEPWRRRGDSWGREDRSSLGLGLVTDKVVNTGEDFLEVGAEKLSNEGSREVEDERYEEIIRATARSHPEDTQSVHPTSPFSEAFLLSSRTYSVP